jgi:hypothetical protein
MILVGLERFLPLGIPNAEKSARMYASLLATNAEFHPTTRIYSRLFRAPNTGVRQASPYNPWWFAAKITRADVQEMGAWCNAHRSLSASLLLYILYRWVSRFISPSSLCIALLGCNDLYQIRTKSITPHLTISARPRVNNGGKPEAQSGCQYRRHTREDSDAILLRSFFRYPSSASPVANGFALAPRRHIQFAVNGQELKFANTQPASNLFQWHETQARCLFLPLCYRLVPLGRILGEPSALKTSLIDGWDRGLFQGSLVYETWDLLAPSKFGMGGGEALPHTSAV